MGLQDRLKVGAEQHQQQQNGAYEDTQLPTPLALAQRLRRREWGR